MDIRIIDNGIVLRYIDAEGTQQETAFLFENETWREDAKAFATKVKDNFGDREERNAHNQIDRVEI